MLFYIGLAAVFAVGLFVFGPATSGSEFVAGYITEYSLSVDNLFVFVIIMARFAVPALAQDKVLYIGIVVSLLLRAVFIVAGAAAIARRELGLLHLRRVPHLHRGPAGHSRARTTRPTSRRTRVLRACGGCCR